MKGGDISNVNQGRMLWVFEGLLAKEPRGLDSVRFNLSWAGHNDYRAIKRWRPIEESTSRLWDLAWRLGFRHDVVTFRGQRFAEAIEKWITHHNLPLNYVQWADASRWPRAMHTQGLLDVVRVFDPDPARAASCAPKAVYIKPAEDFEPLN